MKITSTQWSELWGDSIEQRLVAMIRRHHPEAAALDDGELAQGVRAQLERAADYGLDSERGAASFVYAAWLLGPGFDERVPALAQVLREPALSPLHKADALLDFCRCVFRALAVARNQLKGV